MNLLFDANLSPRLVSRLADLFPGSIHVFETALVRHTPDREVWEYARVHGLTIVTADSDFLELSDTLGAPPKLIRIENCDFRTAEVEMLLRRHAIRIAELESSAQAALVIRRDS